MTQPSNITVIGAGIIGLHTALYLQRMHQVTVLSQDPIEQTTSNAAAAFWMPYRVEPEDKMLKWAKASLPVFSNMARIPYSGVTWGTHTEYFQRLVPRPAWMKLLKTGHPKSLQPPSEWPYYHSAKLPLIDTPKHLLYLAKCFIQLGGVLKTGVTVHDLSTLQDDIVVNCSGMGARKLVQDQGLVPVKGQVIRVTQPTPKIRESALFVYEQDALAIIPHPDHVAIGVTVRTDGLSAQYDAAAEARYLHQAKQLYPQLANTSVLARQVGWRPVHVDGVMLKSERLPTGKLLIHNYGHAGGGVTLAPGCALTVSDLIEYAKH